MQNNLRNDAVGSRWQRLQDVFVRVCREGFVSQLHGLGNGLLGDAATPFVNDGLPSHAFGNHFQRLPHHNSRAEEGWLAVTDFRIGDYVTPE